VGVNRLDDQDYPAVTMGQAAELLGVQPAFLRSLDAADVMQPMRSAGGHRRYSRRQLEFAARMRSLFDQGLTLDAAHRILRLEDELEAARRRIAELERQADDHQITQADDHQTTRTDQRDEQTIGTEQRAERGSAERDGQRTSG
jgi:MerR family transcriptional regulator/heat shock protein HspR